MSIVEIRVGARIPVDAVLDSALSLHNLEPGLGRHFNSGAAGGAGEAAAVLSLALTAFQFASRANGAERALVRQKEFFLGAVKSPENEETEGC